MHNKSNILCRTHRCEARGFLCVPHQRFVHLSLSLFFVFTPTPVCTFSLTPVNNYVWRPLNSQGGYFRLALYASGGRRRSMEFRQHL